MKYIYVVYPKTYIKNGERVKVNKDKLWEYLEVNGDCDSFIRLSDAQKHVKRYGNRWISKEPASDDLWEDIRDEGIDGQEF